MPKLAKYKNLIFFIVSFDLSERLHIHVFSKSNGRGGSAKIWLDTLEVFDQGDLTTEEINTAVKVLGVNIEIIKKAISDFREGKKVKSIELKLK
jgi:hypothetical protein